jgi:hypothetical protein
MIQWIILVRRQTAGKAMGKCEFECGKKERVCSLSLSLPLFIVDP